MLYLSATSIKDLFMCEKCYYYRTHKPDKAVLSDDMIFGTVIHNAIAACSNLQDAVRFAVEAWDKKSKMNFLGESKKPPKSIKRMLTGYYEKILPNFDGTGFVEYDFEILWRKNATLVGKWDRVSESIWDWKTGTTVPNKYVINDIQFHIYGWAYNKVFKKMPKNIYYGHLYTGELYNISMTETHLANVELLLDKAAKMVYNGADARVTGYHCGRCIYRGICWEEFVDESVSS
jgi:CRISPR/Cas system-associated exonuclease Cas4 (RecB family)